MREPFLASILNAVGAKGQNDTLIGTNDVAESEITSTIGSDATALQPTIQAQAIAEYIVATSNLGGDLAPNRMQSALSLASQGDKNITPCDGLNFRCYFSKALLQYKQ